MEDKKELGEENMEHKKQDTHVKSFSVNELLGEKQEKPKKHKKKIDYWKVSSIAFLVLLIISIFTNGFTSFDFTGMAVDGSDTTFSGDKIKLDFYVMSQCPFGTQVEDAVKPVLDKMGDVIDFNLEFIANIDANGNFDSLHGEPEVQGNIVQLCAAEHEPEKYMDMVMCMNKNMQNIPNNWEQCATDSGLDVGTIKTCYEGEQGKVLLTASIEKANQVMATGSPTMFMNDKPFNKRKTDDMLRAICFALDNSHEECKNIPEPVTVELTVINDEQCETCGTDNILGVFNQMFEDLEVKELDFADKEAQDLIKQHNIELLPSYLFEKKVEESSGWKDNANLQAAFKQNNNKYVVIPEAVGAEHNPSKEICDNGKDDRDQDGLIDCDDDDCSNQWVCLPKLDKPEIELFVMSHCPFGTQIEKGMLPVAKLLGDKIDLKVKFCDYAMHDKTELDEQVLQYCVQKDFNDKFIEYLECFLEDGKSDECVTKLEIDKAKLDKCTTDTDKEFKVTANYNDKTEWKGRFPPFAIFQDEVDKYDVRGSPTLVINGVVAEGVGRSPSSLLEGACLGFKNKPTECDQVLSSDTPSAGFGFSAIAPASSGSADAQCG